MNSADQIDPRTPCGGCGTPLDQYCPACRQQILRIEESGVTFGAKVTNVNVSLPPDADAFRRSVGHMEREAIKLRLRRNELVRKPFTEEELRAQRERVDALNFSEEADRMIRQFAGVVVVLILLGLAFYVSAHIDREYFRWLSAK